MRRVVFSLEQDQGKRTRFGRLIATSTHETDDGAGPASRRLAVLLHADVHGYTFVISGDEAATIRRVKAAVALFRETVVAYRGRIVDTVGDSVFAAFENAVAAVECAVALQRDFARANVWQAGGRAIRFRIGLHAGEVYADREGVRGLHVAIAARVQEQAQPGGVCLSEAVHRLLGSAVDGLRSIGTPPLHNVEQAIELFELRFAGFDPPPAAPVEMRPFPARSSGEMSVAVLPLQGSGDPVDAHIGAGVTSDIITNLSRFRELVVLAHHTTMRYRGDGAAERAAQTLNARYVATGTLVRVERKAKITLQLIKAESGRLVWADNFHADLGELLDVEADVAGAIASRVAVRVMAEDLRRLKRGPLQPDLYGLVLRAHDLSFVFKREPTLHAQLLLEQATKMDPAFARAFAGLSRTHNLAWRYGWTDDPEACLARAVDFARRAIDHDDLDARGFQALGFSTLYQKRHDEALAAYGRAHELNPNSADVTAEMADMLNYNGEPERALGFIGRAERLNPFCPDWYHWVAADILFGLGRYDEVIATLRRMHDQSQSHRLFAAAFALKGETGEAKIHAAEILRLQPGFSIEAWRQIPPDRNPEPLDRFIEGLRLAGLR